MRTIAIFVTAITALVAASPALGDDSPAPKKDKSQQIVCRTDAYVGSHIPQRICKTRAEWDEAAKQSQQYLDTARNMPVAPPKGGG